MAWDFSTEPEFEEQLDWMRAFVREEIWPLETIVSQLDQPALDRIYAPLQEEVKRRGLWAAHLPPDLGGQGFGQVKLGLMHEILGTSPFAPNAFGNQAPDSGNSEILALAGTDEQKDRWLHPLLAGDLKSAFSMTEPESAGSDPTELRTRAERDGDELGHQRPQVVLLERLDRRLPDRHGGHRSRRAAPSARLDVHRAGRHARRDDRARRRRRWSIPPSPSASSAITPRSSTRTSHLGPEALLGDAGRRLPASPSTASAPGASTTACAGSACRGARSTCSASARPIATRSGAVLAEKQTVQNWIADSAAQMQAARLMTLHAAWVMDTQGASAARTGHLADQVLRRERAARRGRSRAAGPRRAGLLDRHAARGDVPLRARRALLRRPRRGPPPVGRAPDPARLRGAGRRRAQRARARRGARPRGGSSPTCSRR